MKEIDRLEEDSKCRSIETIVWHLVGQWMIFMVYKCTEEELKYNKEVMIKRLEELTEKPTVDIEAIMEIIRFHSDIIEVQLNDIRYFLEKHFTQKEKSTVDIEAIMEDFYKWINTKWNIWEWFLRIVLEKHLTQKDT